MFLTVHMKSRTTSHSFVDRYMCYLGKLSFSLYIVHFGVLDVIRTVLRLMGAEYQWYLVFIVFPFTLFASCGIAELSKALIEERGIAMGGRVSQSILRTVRANA